MKIKHKMTKRIMSVILCLAFVINLIPFTIVALDGTANSYYDRIVDANTMDLWKKYFDLENLDTSNAGGVWTDKSVFTDASAFGGLISMIDDDKNFLTALSALAANKEVVGYSTVPTDTVLILDLSNSMVNYDAEQDLINAANMAINRLLDINKNNRIGVVLYSGDNDSTSSYSGAVKRILPIDRYSTTDADGRYLNLANNGYVSVNSRVTGAKGDDSILDNSNRKDFEGATYIQAGLWEAWEMFSEIPVEDTVIGDNNWQKGEARMPIVVLMSDGAPTQATSYYNDVKNSQYTTSGFFGGTTVYASNVGNGNSSGVPAGQSFLVQLTASYIKNRIENHYGVKGENGAGRSLFYTLGFNLSGNSIAESVLNPDASTITDSLWRSFLSLGSGAMNVTVKGRNSGTAQVAVSKDSYATSKSYVDEYFSASSGDDALSNAFSDIVNEIILQSRYYPTHLEGGSPDFSGYVEFEDIIGEYMEVKDIKGILLGTVLYDGHMMASKLSDSSDGGLGTVENPTALGDEFIRAVKTRLGIASTADAQALVANAFAAGQLKYNSETDWSNYIGWYAKADGTYVGFWDEKSTASAPANAVYKMKSYGFLGETTGSIKNSDMMYMTVQVRTDIATGEQAVIWRIPASLVPMITYLVTLDGTSVDDAQNVRVSVENADQVSPIRLVFESGLRSDLNELNITRITDSKHIADDGVTRQFWTNYFSIPETSPHSEHITTISEFTPSKENERFYYTFDSAVHKKVGDEFVLVEEDEGTNGKLDTTKEYYHRRYIFKNFDSSVPEADRKPEFRYEKMSAASIAAAKWDGTFKTKTGEVGAYVVLQGTPARELEMYKETKTSNDTDSAEMVFYPYLSEENNIFYVDMNLGNNGLLKVTPAQGIKLSKTIDVYETGTSDEFKFRITVKNASGALVSGSFDSWITSLDVVPTGSATKITFSNGVYEVDLTRNQTFWLSGLPTGATYTIEEISTNDDYKIKSVHVNGASSGAAAKGTIAAYFIDDVDFVNTAIGEGDLVITKQVVDENGRLVDINDNIKFTAEVTLTDKSGNPVSGTFEASNAAGQITISASGKFTVTLSDGESFVVRNVPEETRYSVDEIDIPSGFVLNENRSDLYGEVDSDTNDQALIVNTYKPEGTDGENVTIDVTKTIDGSRQEWRDGESYSFEVRSLGTTGVVGSPIASFVIDSDDADKKYTLNLSGEDYTEAGTYHYSITENKGTAGGITYDTAQRRFAVVVADEDMDGDLEITAVTNEAYTSVTSSSGGYTVSANFTNIYEPTGSDTVTIDVIKKMDGDYRLNGFQFALYDSDDLDNADEILRSTVTDATGKAQFAITYTPDQASIEGSVYNYYLAEINTGNPNITYDTAIYTVKVTVLDNGDGTISATSEITAVSEGTLSEALDGNGNPTFTNTFTPSASAFVTITANKTIKGDRVLNVNEFSFVIESDTENAPMPASTTVKNAANGAVVFGAIEFTSAGVYVYRVYESQENKIGGFTYDSRFYEITVTVTDFDAKLYAVVTREVKENESDTGTQLDDKEIITFVNEYSADETKVPISGTKILTGKKLQENEFTFVLTPDNAENPMPDGFNGDNEGFEVKNNADRLFTFGEITYTKAGVYTYTVIEKPNGDARYDFDESVYKITVTVTDNSEGKLLSKITMTKNEVASNEIVFRNGFVPTGITYDISEKFGGEKILEGREGRPLEAGEFEFVLINAVNGYQIGESVKNDANGKFEFPEVALSETGTYHFKITEVTGDKIGVSYDTSSYHILLNVVQNNEGELEVVEVDDADLGHEAPKLYKGTVTKEEVGGTLTEVVHYDDITDGGSIVFVNEYKANDTEIIVDGTKTLTGRELVGEDFSFTLCDESGEEIQTVTNDDQGYFAFDPIPVSEEGEYIYTVFEVQGSEDGMTYDGSIYTVKATVTDNLDGTFKIDYAYAKGGDTVEGITFVNSYYESPNTGDSSNLWLALILVSGACLAGSAVYSKKRRKVEEN